MAESPSTPSDESAPDPNSDEPANQDYLGSLLELQGDCARQLSRLAVEMQERAGRSFADYRRAMAEAQIDMQSQHEIAARRFSSVMARGAGPTEATDMNNVQEGYQSALRESQETAQSAAERAAEKYTTTMSDEIDEANQLWDAAVTDYVRGIKDMAARLDPENVDPQALGALGQSFAWISQHVHRQSE